MVLGEVLRRAREGLNRSPEQVGALVGISGRTVRRLEAGMPERPGGSRSMRSLASTVSTPTRSPSSPNTSSTRQPVPGTFSLICVERVAELLGPGVAEALEGVEEEPVELAMRLAARERTTCR